MFNLFLIFRFIHIYILLIIFDFELKRKGFARVFNTYKRKFEVECPLSSEEEYRMHMHDIFKFFEMLDIVCAWYPRKADCIHKTFIGYKIMRRKYNVPVQIVVGVRKFPLEAHAWLKNGNRNLFGDEVDTNKYKIVMHSN